MANLTREEYIKKFYPEVVVATKGSGIFPEVAIMQSALESGNGNSSLASVYNNHFGIKADSSWKGKKVNLDTREVFSGKSVYIKDSFRVYNSYEESARDYVKFLKTHSRYTNAGVFKAKTPQEQIEAIKRAGYATDPNYATIIKSMISRNIELLNQLNIPNYAPELAILIILTGFASYKLYKLYK